MKRSVDRGGRTRMRRHDAAGDGAFMAEKEQAAKEQAALRST